MNPFPIGNRRRIRFSSGTAPRQIATGRLRRATGPVAPIRILEAIGEGRCFALSTTPDGRTTSISTFQPTRNWSAPNWSKNPTNHRRAAPASNSRWSKCSVGRSLPPTNWPDSSTLNLEPVDQQFDVVAFLDGNEKQKKAVLASVDEFRQTWKRPKWHVFVQK